MISTCGKQRTCRAMTTNAQEESVRLGAVLWVELAASCVELLFDFTESSRVRDNLVRVISQFLLDGGQVQSCYSE